MKYSVNNILLVVALLVILFLTFILISLLPYFSEQHFIIIDCDKKIAFQCDVRINPPLCQCFPKHHHLLRHAVFRHTLGYTDCDERLITDVSNIMDLNSALIAERKWMAELKSTGMNFDHPVDLRWEGYMCTNFAGQRLNGFIERIEEKPVSQDVVKIIAEMTRINEGDINKMAYSCTAEIRQEKWDTNAGAMRLLNYFVITNGCLFFGEILEQYASHHH